MGQRLVIEIRTKNIAGTSEVLASAYYHWSAYSGVALDLLGTISKKYHEIQNKIISEKKIAVEMLQSIGAGIEDAERESIEGSPEYEGFIFKSCVSRNDGILCVTDEGVQENRIAADYLIILDLDSETFSFDVASFLTEPEYYDRVETGVIYNELPTYSLDFSNIPLSSIDALTGVYVCNPNGIKAFWDGEKYAIMWVE